MEGRDERRRHHKKVSGFYPGAIVPHRNMGNLENALINLYSASDSPDNKERPGPNASRAAVEKLWFNSKRKCLGL